MNWTIAAVCTGTARPFNGAELSAIAKRPREGIVQVLTEGLAPDEQADRRVHGGPEMALHGDADRQPGLRSTGGNSGADS